MATTISIGYVKAARAVTKGTDAPGGSFSVSIRIEREHFSSNAEVFQAIREAISLAENNDSPWPW